MKKRQNTYLNETSPLEHIFGSKTRVRILNLFFANPSDRFYLREISRRIGIRLHSVRREVENLKRYDIILEEAGSNFPKGKNQTGKKFFVLNDGSLIYPELKALLLKGHLFSENDLVKAITKIGPVSLIILCGAFVDDKDASTDILIVGKASSVKLERVVKNFEKKLGFEIRYTLMPKKEYKYRKLIGDRFLCTILENKHEVALDKMPQKL